MADNVGVWIDHQQAVIVVPDGGATTIKSHLEAHTRYTGSGGHPGSSGSQSGGSEKRYEARARGQLNRYLDTVVAAIGPARSVWLFGPGEAKSQLRARLNRLRTMPKPAIATANADKLTHRQVVAHVLAHFDGSSRAVTPRATRTRR